MKTIRRERFRHWDLRHWDFTLALFACYLILFHLWNHTHYSLAVVTGLSGAFAGTLALIFKNKTGYFVNRWDLFGHAAVLLDIALEATLVPSHQGLGFYGCAIAFAIVIAAYRMHRGTRSLSLRAMAL